MALKASLQRLCLAQPLRHLLSGCGRVDRCQIVAKSTVKAGQQVERARSLESPVSTDAATLGLVGNGRVHREASPPQPIPWIGGETEGVTQFVRYGREQIRFARGGTTRLGIADERVELLAGAALRSLEL